MINSNELRIGNYVNLSGLVQKITASMICEQDIYDKSNSVLFEPIPITEQWLLDLGGIDSVYEIVIQVKRRKFVFKWNSRIVKTGLRLGWYCKRYKHIKYVHQLQNLVHALTGEELTLKK